MTSTTLKRPILTLPNGGDKLLLHSCCEPCSGEVMEAIQASGLHYTIFFYNPNIHPQKEYLIRKAENIRFELTALYAAENGFTVISSSLGISRWKNMQQINNCGQRAASHYPGMVYWDYNWRKGGGSARMIEISKREQFYQQEYCGCVYSLRDSNLHRKREIPHSTCHSRVFSVIPPKAGISYRGNAFFLPEIPGFSRR
ncbi:MAG: epoxyqueuosine reductase QueH [Symbiopectobacterium sp.]|uniref:epoxyqueuosine reductase QueH n=1 Tax=Symbiopectobacterium sp. TaxID=2952789 RepID=UPI003F419311